MSVWEARFEVGNMEFCMQACLISTFIYNRFNFCCVMLLILLFLLQTVFDTRLC